MEATTKQLGEASCGCLIQRTAIGDEKKVAYTVGLSTLFRQVWYFGFGARE